MSLKYWRAAPARKTLLEAVVLLNVESVLLCLRTTTSHKFVRLIDCVYHSTLGLRVIHNEQKTCPEDSSRSGHPPEPRLDNPLEHPRGRTPSAR